MMDSKISRKQKLKILIYCEVLAITYAMETAEQNSNSIDYMYGRTTG